MNSRVQNTGDARYFLELISDFRVNQSRDGYFARCYATMGHLPVSKPEFRGP